MTTLRILALAAIVGMVTTPASAKTPTLTFGVVPQQSASQLARVWAPLLQQVGERAGVEVRFVTARDIPTFEDCLGRGAYDAAYMNPFHYIVFQKRSGYRAIAHEKDAMLRGLLVARKDDQIRGLEDLGGASIAFPSPAALGASVLPQAELARRGIDFKPVYVKSHDSVYRGVADGLFPAGGGVARTFATIPADVRDRLTVFYETAAYTPHAIALGPEVDRRMEEQLLDALLAVGESAPDLVAALGMTGFQAASDSDWDDIRALGLDDRAAQMLAEGENACLSD